MAQSGRKRAAETLNSLRATISFASRARPLPIPHAVEPGRRARLGPAAKHPRHVRQRDAALLSDSRTFSTGGANTRPSAQGPWSRLLVKTLSSADQIGFACGIAGDASQANPSAQSRGVASTPSSARLGPRLLQPGAHRSTLMREAASPSKRPAPASMSNMTCGARDDVPA